MVGIKNDDSKDGKKDQENRLGIKKIESLLIEKRNEKIAIGFKND